MIAADATRSRAFVLLRYTLTAATAYLVLVEGNFALPSTPVLLVIAAAFASNVLATMLPPRLLESKFFTFGAILGDTVWITGALLLSGHFTSEFFYLYFFLLLL